MKIVVISSHTKSLYWIRMDMMKELVKRGYSVIAVGNESESRWKAQFAEYGIDYRQLKIDRNGLNPFSDIQTLKTLYDFMIKERPDKVFAYQAKPIVYGSIAASLCGITEVYLLVAGLGSVMRGSGAINAIIKGIMNIEYRIACRCSKIVFFQNHDDRNVFIQNGLVKKSKTAIISGSGVNMERFQVVPFPDRFAFLFIGRLLRDKGVMEYLEACKMVKQSNPNVRFMLIGPYDSNPSALKPTNLQPYLDAGVIEYFGEQMDVRPFIAQSSVFVLPSYHEGTPKTVLEAMAMGRPIITTNAPGCRETVIDGENGFLVPIADAKALADRMQWFVDNSGKIEDMGMASYQFCREKFNVVKVNEKILRVMGLYGREDGEMTQDTRNKPLMNDFTIDDSQLISINAPDDGFHHSE